MSIPILILGLVRVELAVVELIGPDVSIPVVSRES